MVKHLVREALPVVVIKDDLSRNALREFVERRIRQEDQPNYTALANILVAENPMRQMTNSWVDALTANSLQSVDQLLSVASHFNIQSNVIVTNPYELRRVFELRNQIVHEMDIDFNHPHRNRRPRRRDTMIAATNELLGVAERFLAAVDAKLT